MASVVERGRLVCDAVSRVRAGQQIADLAEQFPVRARRTVATALLERVAHQLAQLLAVGVRMFAEPIREIELLHEKRLAVENAAVAPDRPLSIATSGRLFDIRATLDLGRAERLGLKIAGRQVVYDCRAGELDGMPLAPVEGKVRVQILVDRPSIEICGNRGRVYKTDSFRSQDPIEAIEVFAAGGAATVDSLEVYPLRSAWKR